MRAEDVDALLVLSFGGPESRDEVMPFLRRVSAGRNVPEERLSVVAEQYFTLGGISPLNRHNRELVRRLRDQAPARWKGERVYLANRNSAPFVSETFLELSRLGINRIAVFKTSAFSSYSSCRQYTEDLERGQAEAGTDLVWKQLPRFSDDPVLVRIWSDRIASAGVVPRTRILFVTHSLPTAMAHRYLPEHRALAAVLGGAADWVLCFQSRSGPPSQPWLEPDIGEEIDRAAADGITRVVVAPIGFLADNLEIRWDLDVTAGARAADLGLAFERLDPPQSDPRFTDMIWGQFRRSDGASCPVDCCAWTH